MVVQQIRIDFNVTPEISRFFCVYETRFAKVYSIV